MPKKNIPFRVGETIIYIGDNQKYRVDRIRRCRSRDQNNPACRRCDGRELGIGFDDYYCSMHFRHTYIVIKNYGDVDDA